jgi:hypothetical protein
MRFIITEEEKRNIRKLYEIENVGISLETDPRVREFSLMVYNYLEDKKDRDILIEKYYEFKKSFIENNDFVSVSKLNRHFKKIDLSCDDLKNYVSEFFIGLTFVDDLEKTKEIDFIKNLLKEKNCINAVGYLDTIKFLLSDEESVEFLLEKAKHEKTIGNIDESIKTYNQLISKTTDGNQKEIFQYEILEMYFKNKKDYKKSYSIAMKITGTNKSKALGIAAKCVNLYSWDNCGDSTFERSVNYMYAAKLASSAGNYTDAAKYMAKAPCNSDWFSEETPSSITLPCWVDPNTNMAVSLELNNFYKTNVDSMGDTINPYSKTIIKCKRPENRSKPFHGNYDFE